MANVNANLVLVELDVINAKQISGVIQIKNATVDILIKHFYGYSLQ